MKLSNIRHSRSGFTIVELVIAMTIFAIMSTMTILIYFNVSENARRLQIARELQESAREITERISQDVRSQGILIPINIPGTPEVQYNYPNNPFKQTQTSYFPWNNNNDYANGGEILLIGKNINESVNSPKIIRTTAKKIYVYAKRDLDNPTSPLQPCTSMNWSDTKSYCSLYLADLDTSGNIVGEAYNLTDSFRANDADKRVKITDLKFYISGGSQDANKVTLKMTLELMPRGGVPQSLIKSTKLEIQTTFSERAYKIN